MKLLSCSKATQQGAVLADPDLDPQADSGLVDRIYEAAFVPDLWPDVLGEIGTLSAAPAAM